MSTKKTRKWNLHKPRVNVNAGKNYCNPTMPFQPGPAVLLVPIGPLPHHTVPPGPGGPGPGGPGAWGPGSQAQGAAPSTMPQDSRKASFVIHAGRCFLASIVTSSFVQRSRRVRMCVFNAFSVLSSHVPLNIRNAVLRNTRIVLSALTFRSPTAIPAAAMPNSI